MSFIVIIESHPLIRLGLLRLLSNIRQRLIIKAYDHDDFETEQIEKKSCDLVIISINPCENSEKQILNINNKYTPKSILLFCQETEIPDYLLDVSPSISGVIHKNASSEIVIAAVSLVLAGGTCFPTQQALNVDDYRFLGNDKQSQNMDGSIIKEPKTRSTNDEAKLLGITPRQYQVLVLLSQGYSLKEISMRLNISIATSKAHTETLYQRLNVSNRNEAVYQAVARGATLGWSNIKPTGTARSKPDHTDL